MAAKQKSRRTGETSRTPGVRDPVAKYVPDTNPVISIDATGRLVLPKKIRDHYHATKFEVRETKGRIELIPLKPLSSLFGIFPDLDIEALYREHDREVEEEDEDDRSQNSG